MHVHFWLNGLFYKGNKKRSKFTNKKKGKLDNYNRLPYNYETKVGYDTLIRKVSFKEINNLLGATVVDIDIELKMKISKIKYLESRLLKLCSFISM